MVYSEYKILVSTQMIRVAHYGQRAHPGCSTDVWRRTCRHGQPAQEGLPTYSEDKAQGQEASPAHSHSPSPPIRETWDSDLKVMAP